MIVELFQARTADGVRLDGSLQIPDWTVRSMPTTVWLLLHGAGSNFYAGGVLQEFAVQTIRSGWAVARVNTRGHDVICHLPGSHRPHSGGAAFESIADCVADVRAWIDELVHRGFQRVVLVGHSLGGVKAIYSQAHDPHPNVIALVGVSPPRFCHAEWQASPKSAAFRDHFRQATELVESGRGGELLEVQQPLPMWLTAAGFVAKYGPHDEYDFVPLLTRLRCPALLIVGTESVASSPAFESTPEAVQRIQQAQPGVQLELVAGANTGYSGLLDVPARLAAAWLTSVVDAAN